VFFQEYKSIFITRVSEVRETLLPLYLLVAVCDAVAYLRAGLHRTIPIYEIFIPQGPQKSIFSVSYGILK
jgi:hypothetical protein